MGGRTYKENPTKRTKQKQLKKEIKEANPTREKRVRKKKEGRKRRKKKRGKTVLVREEELDGGPSRTTNQSRIIQNYLHIDGDCLV